MRFITALLSAIAAAISMNAALAIEPVTVEATTLNRVFIENAPGQPSSIVPLQMRDNSGCEWFLAATLDPIAQRIMGRAETKRCGTIEQPVRGYLVGADDLSGLGIDCLDLYRNEAGSIMCVSAGVPEGTPGWVVIQTN